LGVEKYPREEELPFSLAQPGQILKTGTEDVPVQAGEQAGVVTIIQVLQRISPDLINCLIARYNILRNVYFNQPVGRRLLAGRLELPERSVRSDLEFLREYGFLRSEPAGMTVTAEGEAVIWQLEELIRGLSGVNTLEAGLKEKLGLRVTIVPGDSDHDPVVKADLGRVAAHVLKKHLREGQIVALTGGSTVAALAENMIPVPARGVLVVPARGGLSQPFQYQANFVVARLAEKIGASYHLLHIPDNLAPEALEKVLNDPQMQGLIKTIKSANILVHGIGLAEEMARKRGSTDSELTRLLQRGAVGEALGCYFNLKGEIVRAISTAAIQHDDLDRLDLIIAVAGGRRKAPAVLAALPRRPQDILVTDEGAAREMMNILDQTPATGQTAVDNPAMP
jgi:central glycolytic genes regulator